MDRLQKVGLLVNLFNSKSLSTKANSSNPSTHLLMRVFLQIFCLPILVRSVEVVVGIDVDVVIEEVSGRLCCGKIFDITGKFGVEN
jgi:argonaute-like protein implicated in RNA metabolism and viral defense